MMELYYTSSVTSHQRELENSYLCLRAYVVISVKKKNYYSTYFCFSPFKF